MPPALPEVSDSLRHSQMTVRSLSFVHGNLRPPHLPHGLPAVRSGRRPLADSRIRTQPAKVSETFDDRGAAGAARRRTRGGLRGLSRATSSHAWTDERRLALPH